MSAVRLKGHLDMMLLQILGGGEMHGYRVVCELRDRSGGAFDLPEGTVYPALHRLEKRGLLNSAWDTTGPRRRRVYRLSASGSRALAAERREWIRFVDAVGSVMAVTA